jgi:hypothetical protein
VSNLSLLTIGSYSNDYYIGYNGGREMSTGQGCGMVIGGCSQLCPAATGRNWVALFPCPCQLRTVRCMDPGQVTDLLIPSTY